MKLKQLIGSILAFNLLFSASVAIGQEKKPIRPFVEFPPPPEDISPVESRSTRVISPEDQEVIVAAKGESLPADAGPPPTVTVTINPKNVDVPYSSATGSTSINWSYQRPGGLPTHFWQYACIYKITDPVTGNEDGTLIDCKENGSNYLTNVSLQFGHAYRFYFQVQATSSQTPRGTAGTLVLSTSPYALTVTTSRPIDISIYPNPATIPAGATSTQITINWSKSSTYTASMVTWYGINNIPPYTGQIWCLGSPASSGTTQANVSSGQVSTLYVVPYDGCVAGTTAGSVPLPILNQVSYYTTN